MIERIIPFAHNKIKEYITKEDICIDMTAGNGNDTLFLSSLCKHVFSFDVQHKAIKNTVELMEDNDVSNATVIHDSHVNINNYINEKVTCAMFNLGYLPSSDKSITTTSDTTLQALTNLLPLMRQNSIISLTIYIGHEQGKDESKAVEEYVSTLPSKTYNVLKYKFLNKKNAPYNIFIEKIGE